MTPTNLYESYIAVYDDDLRQQLTYVEEDLSFIDELTDDELCLVMENLIVTEQVDVNECFESLEYFLSEATVTYGHEDQPRRDRMAARTADRQRQVRVGRMKQAAGRAAEKVASGVSKGAKFLGGKLASAGRKIGRFLGRVGSAAKAGYSAAKSDFASTGGSSSSSRQSPPQGSYRGQGVGRRERVGSAVRSAAAASTSGSTVTGGGTRSTDRPAASSKVTGGESRSTDRQTRAGRATIRPNAGAGRKDVVGRTGGVGQSGSISSRGGSIGRERTSSNGPVGLLPQGKKGATKSSYDTKTLFHNKRLNKRVGMAEDFEFIAQWLLEDIINEGYANDYDEAYEILNSMSDYDIGEIAEGIMLMNEDIFRDDVFDNIFEYLLDEGYADTEDDAVTIMANMSEEWREQIVDEATVMSVTSPEGKSRRLNATKAKPSRELSGSERTSAIRQMKHQKVVRKYSDPENVEKFRRRHGL